MKNIRVIDGFSYRLRPVSLNDAQFIIDVRLEDLERNKYIHKISSDLYLQQKWIESYLERDFDYYFVIENIFTEESEGLIGLYNLNSDSASAEWGRWVIRKGSLAAVESVALIYKLAFDILGLESIYCRTLSDNKAVVSFHNSILEHQSDHKETMEVDGVNCDVTRHFVDKNYYYNFFKENIENLTLKYFLRNLRVYLGRIEFHHIGIATRDIEREFNSYKLVGYTKETDVFVDEIQGVIGRFIKSNYNGPRLELLQNFQDSKTLSTFLDRGVKLYHFGFLVENFDRYISFFLKQQCFIVRKEAVSSYFGKRIVFIMMKNSFIIELIEK